MAAVEEKGAVHCNMTDIILLNFEEVITKYINSKRKTGKLRNIPDYNAALPPASASVCVSGRHVGRMFIQNSFL